MARGYRYSDAVRLLGGQDPTLKVLETVLGAGTLGMWDLIDAKGELIKVGNDLLGRWREWRVGQKWSSRTERLEAAHTILVVTAFLEALHQRLPLSDLKRLGLSKTEQEQVLDAEDVPCPAPQWPFERNLYRIQEIYHAYSKRMLDFLSGLRLYDHLSTYEWERVHATCQQSLHMTAMKLYEDRFRQLAVEVPEFALWARMTDHQATRRQLTNLRRLLTPGLTGQALPVQLETISRLHRAALDRPIAETGDAPEGMRLPTLQEAYITPSFRVAEMPAIGDPNSESAFESCEVRRDLPDFLAGHLTKGMAMRLPLVVLGQPGAGKSVLTKVLSALLPEESFLPIRVPLREVAAEKDLQQQIEQAVYHLSGERLEWPALARGAEGVLRIVLLDGFDELLQATGVHQSDYLEKVARFQQRELDAGRAVAFIVTSRTAVAHRAAFPAGTVVVRLEPFDDEQIDGWLDVWNSNNAAYFRDRGLQPLASETAKAQRHLAEQPLLLLMLALFDADGNALRTIAQLKQVDLYELLIRKFIERELKKSYPEDRVLVHVEQEMQQLSCVAFSMFNRGRQWTTAEEFDQDLKGLGLARKTEQEAEFAVPLTAGDLTPGKFFFVHEARATVDKQKLQTFEFLHATFGEFLIARLLASLLHELLAQEKSLILRDIDDGLMRALLSWALLSTRTPVLSFLKEMAERGDKAWWQVLSVRLFRRLDMREDNSYLEYRPATAGPQRRYAYYSANLALIALICAGETRLSAVMPGREDTITEWQRYALLWRSQCTAEAWRSLVDTILVDSESMSIDLKIASMSERSNAPVRFGPPRKILWEGDVLWMRDEAVFSFHADVNTLVQAVGPMLSPEGARAEAFGDALHSLMDVLMLPKTATLAQMVVTYTAAIKECGVYSDPLVKVMVGHLSGLSREISRELVHRVKTMSGSASTIMGTVETIMDEVRATTPSGQAALRPSGGDRQIP
ncbi:NACHT domain-containing protein [Nonomuraea harbinensis]|uniref:NACHT domain-containing protein n=1 Tax=Nonomuraea harbinensis TaxID=1286938 RepID=A0ABW1C8C4_9ACTN|nr:hypothetical protein [Nonomuraea harbinensis]